MVLSMCQGGISARATLRLDRVGELAARPSYVMSDIGAIEFG